jgi:hypothetical protein
MPGSPAAGGSDGRADTTVESTAVQEPLPDAERPALRAWTKLGSGGGDEIRIYRNLADMTKHAPTIVHARVQHVAPGRVNGLEDGPDAAFQAVRMELRVDEVIASDEFAQGDLIPIELGSFRTAPMSSRGWRRP